MSGGSLTTPSGATAATSCHPVKATTLSPTAKSVDLLASTRQTAAPGMGSPISAAGAYECPAFMRPRM